MSPGRAPRPGGLGRVVRAGLGRRRLQTGVMALTTLIAVAAATLALGLLVSSRGPFDRAFEGQDGAHLTVRFAGSVGVTQQQFGDTARAAGVADAAGPYPLASVRLWPLRETPPGYTPPPSTLVGRAAPDGPVDRVALVDGRWAQAPGEIVLERATLPPGIQQGARVRAGQVELTVVGIASSAGRSADAWVVPEQVARLTTAPPDVQMLYRLASSGTAEDVRAGQEAITAAAPAGALIGARSYLDVRQVAQQNTAAFVPFLTVFAFLGLAMSVLVIGTVVSGAVATGTRRIGILKSLGFTPLQVGRAYMAQALLPASAGALLGVLLGNALAVPVMAQVAEVYGTASAPVPAWVDVLVPTVALLVVAATAFVPALRAARLPAALVIGRGAGVAGARRGLRARHALGRLPLPQSVVLGLAGPLARPARSATTASAVAFGALAVTLAVGLGGTLVAVQTEGDPDRSGAVTVRTVLPPQGGPEASLAARPADPAAVARVLQGHPGIRSLWRTSRTEVDVAGLTGGAPLVAYEGEDTGAGTAMISGRWFAAQGEAVVAGRFLKATGLRVGDGLVVSEQGRSARLTIVGEVFDLGDDGMTLRTSSASVAALESPYLPAVFGVELTSGTDRDRCLAELNQVLEPLGAQASATESPSSSVLAAMQGLIAMLTLMLVAVAGLGVLNTVVLDTRDRVRDQGVLKALGMTPRQTLVQVLTGVAAIGLVAGAVGAPLGTALHRAVMPAMGRAAGFTIPQAFIDVHGGLLPVLMALAGVPIAVAGALAPAFWAARTRTARALRAE
ncbi:MULTISPECIES: ABC transporter permease [unclassified Streptomyces]|uniref:ABC transporter permease n=1 Tax=unclassified Streptomyces TaxID=2593676 RepID=UPI0007C48E54|nr:MULTISPECIES: ABC transporter permease [unclassified Streptomyces]